MGPPKSDEPDRGRGSDDSLYRLYDLVPEAEDIDIAEEWDQNRPEGDVESELRRPGVDADNAPLDDLPPEPELTDDDEDSHLTQGQVLGMLEHRLGAERIDDSTVEDDS